MNRHFLFLFNALTILLITLAGCAPASTADQGLVLEKHPLAGDPQTEPLQFTPVEGSMQDILQKHAAEREDYLTQQTTYLEGRSAIQSELDGKTLLAELFYEDGGMQGYVTVSLDGSEIYRIDTGPGSPLTPLAGLWVVDGSWWLETVLVNLEGEPFATGQISQDGALLNTSLDYQEAFGLQTIGGSPFYFFSRDGKIGYWYQDQETMLDYEEIPHYQCCSGSVLNPRSSQNMVSFFARSGSQWSYVELGLFGK